MIFTQQLLDAVSAFGPSEAVSLEGVGVRLHLTASATGGAGAVVYVESSFDGSHWVQLFDANFASGLTVDVDGPAEGVALKFVRLRYAGGDATSVSGTLTAFQ